MDTTLKKIVRSELTPRQLMVWDSVRSIKPGGMGVIGYGGAAGGGKTRAIVELAIDLATDYPGNNIVIGRKDYSDLRDTTMRMFNQHCPRAFVVRRNMTEHWVEIREANWPEGVVSRITFREMKDWMGLGSEEYGAVLLDEAGEIPKNTALMLLSRLRWKLPDIVMSTPRTPETPWGRRTKDYPDGAPIKYVFLSCSNPYPGWFEDWFVKRVLDEESLASTGGKISFIPALPSDNPHLAEGYEARLRSIYPEHWVKRLMDGRWDAFEGQVYPQFNELIHKYNAPLPPPETWARIIGGLDFGGNNPHDHMSAGVVAIELKSNRIIRVGEFEQRGNNVLTHQMSWMLAMEAQWCNKHTGPRIHWVADKTQVAAIPMWKRMGFKVKPSKGGPKSVEWGISMVGRRLDTDASGFPGSFYLPSLEKFPERMRAYRYKEDSGDDNKPVQRDPIKRNDDLVDADRYMHENLESTYGDPDKEVRYALPYVSFTPSTKTGGARRELDDIWLRR